MDAYSLDLRVRVLAVCDQGLHTLGEIAELFCVSVSWITKLKRQRRDTGDISPKKRGGPWRRKLDEEGDRLLKELVAQHPDARLQELCEAHPTPMSDSAMSRALARLGVTRKKSPPGGRAGPARRGPGASGVAA